MNVKNRRALTWTIVALGIAFVALGVVLVVTLPESAFKNFPFSRYWSQNEWEGTRTPAPDNGASPEGGVAPERGVTPERGVQGFWSFRHHRGPSMMGPGIMFGGGFLVVGAIVLFFIILPKRWKHPFPGREGWGVNNDPVEILRRTFAEGKIMEEEYKKRLKVLQEGGKS